MLVLKIMYVVLCVCGSFDCSSLYMLLINYAFPLLYVNLLNRVHYFLQQNVSAFNVSKYSTVPEATLDIQVCHELLNCTDTAYLFVIFENASFRMKCITGMSDKLKSLSCTRYSVFL